MIAYFPILAFYGLATFRMAVMLSSDSGPFNIFERLRSWIKREARHNKPLRDSAVHLGITCIRCDSLWIAFPVAAFACFHRHLPAWFAATGDIFLGSMALSAIAVLLNRAFPSKR